MPIELVKAYMESLDIILSQEALVNIETNSFPHMANKKNREKTISKYEKMAFKLKEKEIVNVDEMIGKLNHGR